METTSKFEDSSVERLKIHHRSFMRAIHESLKAWPTGASDIFRALNMNPVLSINQFNPSDYEHAPSLLTTLEVLDYMGPDARRVAAEIADMAGCVTVPTTANRNSAASLDDAINNLASKMGKSLRAANDLPARPTMTERLELRDSLQSMIDAAHLAMIKLSTGAPRQFENPAPLDSTNARPEGGAPACSVAQGYKETRGVGR